MPHQVSWDNKLINKYLTYYYFLYIFLLVYKGLVFIYILVN